VLDSKEYYNLVYEKYGAEWNEIIFKNTEKQVPLVGEPKLEESKMIYNERFSAANMGGFCEAINYTINCDGSCGSNACDGFACSTGQCIQTSVSYVYCGGIGDNLEADPLHISTGGAPSGGGGNDYSGIYIPNPYDGEADLNNPEFVLATQVAAFTRTLSASNPAIKNVLNNNFWLFPNIVNFIRNNGGMTQINTSAVTFALTSYIYVSNTDFSQFTSIEANQFKSNIFIHLLNNPTIENQNLVIQIRNSSLNNTIFSLSPFFKYPENSNYSTLYPNFTILVKEYIPSLKSEEILINTIHNLTSVSNTQIIDGLEWGDGPEIHISDLGNDPSGNPYYGKFNKNEPNKIYIDIDLVNQLELISNNPNPTQNELKLIGDLNAMIVFSVCLHEYVHYNDFAFDASMQDTQDIELGLLFEELFLGGFYDFNQEGNVIFIKKN